MTEETDKIFDDLQDELVKSGMDMTEQIIKENVLDLIKFAFDALLSIAESQKALAAQAKSNNPIHNPQVDL